MSYEVLLIPEDEGGFSVVCPALPGCVSQGESEDEALANIATAIREYLDVRVELFSGAKGKRAMVRVGVG